MGRPLRVVYAGATYHVMARGNNREAIFADDVDRYAYLTLLAKAARATGLRTLAYVLMPNHVHFVVRTSEANLSSAIHRLHSPYAIYFNRRSGRDGHVFGRRFRSHLITLDSYLLAVTRYVHLNPVRAGLAPRPEDYPWSSYRFYVDHPPDQSLVDAGAVLALISTDNSRSRKAYARFVADGISQAVRSPRHVQPA